MEKVGQVGQSKISNKTKMEKSWKVGHQEGEKREGERGKRRGGTTGRSRVRSERKEKVRKRTSNKTLDKLIEFVNRSIDLLTCRFFLTKIVQFFYSTLHYWKVGQTKFIQFYQTVIQLCRGEMTYDIGEIW